MSAAACVFFGGWSPRSRAAAARPRRAARFQTSFFVQVAAPTAEDVGAGPFAASVGALGVAAAMLKLEKLALLRELPQVSSW